MAPNLPTHIGQETAGRDESGKFVAGNPGGPGRPKGSRSRLTEDFLGDLAAAWAEHGKDAIDKVVEEDPARFIELVGRATKQGDVTIVNEFRGLTDEQLAEQTENLLVSLIQVLGLERDQVIELVANAEASATEGDETT